MLIQFPDSHAPSQACPPLPFSSQESSAPRSATRGSPPAVPGGARPVDPQRPTRPRPYSWAGRLPPKDRAIVVPPSVRPRPLDRDLCILARRRAYGARGSCAENNEVGADGTAAVAGRRHPGARMETPLRAPNKREGAIGPLVNSSIGGDEDSGQRAASRKRHRKRWRERRENAAGRWQVAAGGRRKRSAGQLVRRSTLP